MHFSYPFLPFSQISKSSPQTLPTFASSNYKKKYDENKENMFIKSAGELFIDLGTMVRAYANSPSSTSDYRHAENDLVRVH
ncbi:hypothetical protein FACS1894199_11730 [Bacteroidia bacterium]|nr:hypothetical protein FACS1894199_11730 [Bacteroidia bacterium]